jgi:3'-phosphoadenosine 5'-phosphosulfate sulfotransferase (PAPS reductase)/FAD synthetase
MKPAKDLEKPTTVNGIRIECAFDEMVELAKLVPHPRNPNTHPKRQIELLAKAFQARGIRAPITVSTRSGFIIRGHGRLMAAQLLNLPAYPVDFQTYENEAEEWADLVADNQLAELAEIDQKLLGEIARDLKGFDVDFETIGFSDKEIDRVLEQLNRELDQGPKFDQSSIIRAGDIEQLKPNDEEHAFLKDRILVVEFSGGKDSSAAALWAKHFYPESRIELNFVDMGADYPLLHLLLHRFAEWLGAELRVTRSPRNMFDEFLRVGKWPHFAHPYCHKLLHGPLDEHFRELGGDKIAVLRGGRVEEKAGGAKAKTKGNRKDRFMTIQRVEGVRFFHPLYFAGKELGENLLRGAGAPVWEGYGFGLGRTCCRICPGQKTGTYAAIKVNFPDVWEELLFFEKRFGPGAWQDPGDESHGSFGDLAQRGMERFRAGGFRVRGL